MLHWHVMGAVSIETEVDDRRSVERAFFDEHRSTKVCNSSMMQIIHGAWWDSDVGRELQIYGRRDRLENSWLFKF